MPSVRIPNLRFLFIVSILASLLGQDASFAAGRKWQRHKTLHYVIFYDAAPQSFIENLAAEAEDLFGQTAKNMGFDNYPPWRREGRVKIYVYNDRDHYLAGGKGDRREGTRGMAHIRKRAISTYFQERDSFLTTTLPHELGHIFFWEYVGFKAQVPGWFSEGIAILQEKRDQQPRDNFVKRMIEKGDYLSLKEMTKGKNTDHDYYYPVAYSATKYLFSRVQGNKADRLYELLREGRSFEEALREVTNNNIPSLQRFNEDWVESIKNSP